MTELSITERGSGPTALFVHGLDSSAEVWDPVVSLLPDHRCVAIDLPGHGLTPEAAEEADYSRDALLADFDDVLGALPRPVIFIGHSLGGYLGLAYALTRPDRLDGMVLVSTGPGFRSPDARRQWNDQVRENAPDYTISEQAAAVAFHVDAMVIDRLPEVTLPLTMVIGDGDKAYLGANDYMEKKLPHARRTTVLGARHYVMRSHPEAIAQAVREMSSAGQT